MRLMQTLYLPLLLLAAAPAAFAQDAPRTPTAIKFLAGTCQEMRHDGEDFTPCKPALAGFAYDDGRESFVFFKEGTDTVAVLFSGLTQKQTVQTDGRISRPIDMIVTGTTPENMLDIDADGSCVFEDPNAGVSTIVCTAKTEKGTYSGRFVTDGNKPDVTSLQ